MKISESYNDGQNWVCFIIPSHWALTEETERMAQKNKWKQSNAKITAVRIYKYLAFFSCGRPRTERWARSCEFLWGRLHIELILAFASVRRMTRVWRGMTGEERRTNCHYTLPCSDPRRRVAAATRCESSVSNTFAPMYICDLCISKPYMSQCTE